jgi:hypothetical protein
MIINATKDPNIQPISRGGTGATSVAGARNALGLGNTSGAVPVANGGTGATTAAAARTNLGVTVANLGLSGAETKTLLWENASPGSSFAEQTIISNASDYDAILIETIYTTGNSNTEIRRITKGQKAIITTIGGYDVNSYMQVRGRAIQFNSEGTVIAEPGYSHRTTENTANAGNQYMIPYKIYGIKGV